MSLTESQLPPLVRLDADFSGETPGGQILAAGTETIADFLAQSEPVGVLWQSLVAIVFENSPNRARLERIGPAARIVYLVAMFDGEVVNGGFSQFFENSSGEHAAETLNALKGIGAVRSADLLQRAMAAAFSSAPIPEDQRRRHEQLRAFLARQPDFFDILDEVYYRGVDALGSKPIEDIHGLLLEFMRRHRQEAIVTSWLSVSAQQPR
jgi:hypothetical protein